MTTTDNRPPPTFSVVDELRAIQKLPAQSERRAIRVRAGVSLSRIARDLGVSPQAVWRWENREDRLKPENALRYGALLEQLAAMCAADETPREAAA
ncbi:helix-turn-helix domain-containing protein [Actinoplanes sp. URMC 104]|uniref:helix-turn-helix domain-containing protein n=1 Tax=Actinoplanes sp. URMC 104 TaxID=3423409 RepID=UPI003F1B5E19